MNNQLARSEGRRAAKFAVRAALAGLDEADARIVLEDALTDMYAPREAVAAAQLAPLPQPPTVVAPPPTRPVELPAPSIAQRVMAVIAQQPDKTFDIDAVCASLPGVGAQEVRSELARLARRDKLDRPTRGRYRWPQHGTNGAASSEAGGAVRAS